MAKINADAGWALYKREQARKWLDHVKRLDNTVRTLQDEIDRQRELLDGVESAQTGAMRVSGTKYRSDFSDALDRLQENIRIYCQEVARFADAQKKAHDLISLLPNRLHVDILKRYYLLGQMEREIAADLCYSCDYIGHAKARALEAVYDVMPAEWKAL